MFIFVMRFFALVFNFCAIIAIKIEVLKKMKKF